MNAQVAVGEDRIVFTQFLPVSSEVAFDAWTKKEQVEAWWGCSETERTESTIDLRVGGSFTHLMRLRNAGMMSVHGTYLEVEPGSRLVTTSVMGAGTGFAFETQTTIEFSPAEDGTIMRVTQDGLPPMPNAADIVTRGVADSIEKLQRFLAR